MEPAELVPHTISLEDGNRFRFLNVMFFRIPAAEHGPVAQ
jgi:hypothetical protein